MTTTYTNNFDFPLMGTGDEVDNWGVVLNNALFTPLDGILGSTLALSASSSDISVSLTQWQNSVFQITGVLTQNISIVFPLSPNDSGGTLAVGGTKVIDNRTTGNFNITVKTAATGSTGVVVPQAVRDPNNSATIIMTARTWVYSDTSNVVLSEDRISNGSVLRVPSTAGSPNGSVVGTAAGTRQAASIVIDRTNALLYSCTTTGTAANAIWAAIAGGTVTPQGYLSAASNTAIITADTTTQTIYYVPSLGGVLPIYNGSFFAIYLLAAQLTLPLTSAQSASQIYDVFAFIPTGTTTPITGTGPAWANATAGSCSRGTGAGTTELATVNGLLVNAVQIIATNNGVTYTVAANQATFLGSIFIDSSAGNVTCNFSYGQNRKWGISNAYNTQPVILRGGDPSSAWQYTSNTWRVSHGDNGNNLTTFCCLPNVRLRPTFTQIVGSALAATAPGTQDNQIGIGVNSPSSPTGMTPYFHFNNAGNTPGAQDTTQLTANTLFAPAIGINKFYALEKCPGGNFGGFGGTETYMVLEAVWPA